MLASMITISRSRRKPHPESAEHSSEISDESKSLRFDLKSDEEGLT